MELVVKLIFVHAQVLECCIQSKHIYYTCRLGMFFFSSQFNLDILFYQLG